MELNAGPTIKHPTMLKSDVPGTCLRVPVGFQQVPANRCRVRVRVSGFGLKKQAGTRHRYPPQVPAKYPPYKNARRQSHNKPGKSIPGSPGELI
ncbi:hypothetical protein PCASD_22303 [Puccinia coronata f. sp. avenae]|uniref:Uncharacterized protein n=1 Tax=Puccinia coronata f. sp. avenae TaxID=200324 RepID=A0A2N5S636_9BASI|nr:hypothetical protein PCASD_22303 [Puccinia coronata f. sp. avenae]